MESRRRLPPEMETPICGGCRDRRCKRRPHSYDLTRFDGQLESAEARSGVPADASSGQTASRNLSAEVPLFEVAQLGDGPSLSCATSLAPGSDDPVFVMEMRRNSVSFPSLATGGDGPDFGCAERIQSIPVGATQVVRDNPSRFLRFETLESQTTRPFLSANRPRGKRVLARFAPRALNRSASAFHSVSQSVCKNFRRLNPAFLRLAPPQSKRGQPADPSEQLPTDNPPPDHAADR